MHTQFIPYGSRKPRPLYLASTAALHFAKPVLERIADKTDGGKTCKRAMLMQVCEITEPQFQRQSEEGEWPALQNKLPAAFPQRDVWRESLESNDACLVPVLSMSEATSYLHTVASAIFQSNGGVALPAVEPRFERTPTSLPCKASHAGQHSAALLADSRFAAADIAALVAAGVVHESGSSV